MLKNLIMFLALTLSVNSFAAQKVNGAGATFPYPIYSKWFSEYQKSHADVEFNYQSIGSGGGIKQVLAQTVDFGATDAPMSDDELKQAKTPIRHIPTVLGAVTVAYNVQGVPAELKLDGATLANIFLGTVTKWNDASIAKLNPKVKLPATDILVVRRSDGSGTSAVFTEYLAAVSPDFKTKVGVGKNVNWPAGIGAKGNEGVTAMVAQTDGAIGYTELAYAINAKINMAAIKNAKGEFVMPSVASITNAAASVKKFDGDLRMSIINVDQKGAYPISSFTYILLPESTTAPVVATKAFLGWALADGQKFASELHYAPLPKKMSEALLKTLK
ncbi:MAG: phosphate ABC transporter substrate-binding protein PstS [Bdellovibrionales bacterium]|nr:phosphate ABC transporter substrate-binding protein PstS [Bdellovibrionales bacterium]